MQTIYENGDFEIKQGNSGKFVATNIPTDKNYTAIFSVCNEGGVFINDLEVESNYYDYVEFIFAPDFTEKWIVPRGEESATYFFDVTLVFGVNQYKDTLVFEGKTRTDKNVITVLSNRPERT